MFLQRGTIWIFKYNSGLSCGHGSVVGIAAGYGLDGPGIKSRWGARLSAPVQTGSGAHPAPCTMGTGSFPRIKSGRAVTLSPHSLLVPWSWKSRAITLLPLWAVRSVQSLSVCTTVHFTFTFTRFTLVFKWFIRAVSGVGLQPLARGLMDICCGCCVLSGRSLCFGLITRPGKS